MNAQSIDRSCRAAFWASPFTTSSDREQRTLAVGAGKRAVQLLHHPQTFGNYFTYGAAIPILGMEARAPFTDGSLRLSDDYCDFGYMWSQLGPPKSAISALTAAPTDDLAYYLPDLCDRLRELVAIQKFGCARSDAFDVLGTEGAQGAISYAFLSLLNANDEVLITDPGYMHFASGPLVAGARVRKIPLTRQNRFRLDPDEVEAKIGPRTRMLILCDPINPFGTVQSKEELLAIVRACERRGVIVLNNITHGTHQTNPAAVHTPVAALSGETDVRHVISATGMSKGYALAALRLGFLGGDPRLLQAVARMRMEVTGIHIHPFAQHAALAALPDDHYVATTTEILRRNLALLRQAVDKVGEVSFAVEPDYGFCACLDVAASGVSAQELTVALFRQGICVIAGDALGEVGATRYVRINYSARNIRNLDRFIAALPVAIRDAQSGRYMPGVQAFYQSKSNRRSKRILIQLERMRSRSFVPVREPHPQRGGVQSTLSSRGLERTHQGKTSNMNSRLPPPFMSGVTLKYGPLDLLGSFFREAYDAAKSYGVHLSFGSFDDLLKVNLANQKTWRAVIPTFDPRYSALDASNALCLLGYNQAGEVVATQACRLFTWKDTNFFEAAKTLRLFYANPERDRRPGETCEITAPTAREIQGRVAFSGAGWYRPDYRGKYLSLIMPRISRACAFTRWSTDFTTSMFQDTVLAGGMAERCGYSNVEWKVHVRGSPMGDIKFAFVWIEPDALIEDLRHFDKLIDAEVNSRVGYRRA